MLQLNLSSHPQVLATPAAVMSRTIQRFPTRQSSEAAAII